MGTFVMMAVVVVPMALAVVAALSDRQPARKRKKYAFLFTGLASINMYMVLANLRSSALAEMHRLKALEGQGAVTPIFWAYTPDPLLAAFVLFGCICLLAGAFQYWRERLEQKQRSNKTHEDTVHGGAKSPPPR